MNANTQEVIARACANPSELLSKFGLIPGTKTVFESPLIRAASHIRDLYPILDYDHRPEAPPWDVDFPYLMTEQFRRGYACFKYAVAKVLQPRTICEIGVGAGTGARAFLAAVPSAHYIGIDDGSKDALEGCGLIAHTKKLLAERGYSHEILMQDSMLLHSVPRADLFHVDGAHDFAHAMNDTKLVIESGSEWILIDDARDPTVAGASMMAAYGSRVMFEWAYFEDTWTGSILLHRTV